MAVVAAVAVAIPGLLYAAVRSGPPGPAARQLTITQLGPAARGGVASSGTLDGQALDGAAGRRPGPGGHRGGLAGNPVIWGPGLGPQTLTRCTLPGPAPGGCWLGRSAPAWRT